MLQGVAKKLHVLGVVAEWSKVPIPVPWPLMA